MLNGLTNIIKINSESAVLCGRDWYKKPDANIFLKAIDESKQNIEEVYYIGDDLKDDIRPCIALGIKCVWVNRENRNMDENIVSVNDLSEIKFGEGVS